MKSIAGCPNWMPGRRRKLWRVISKAAEAAVKAAAVDRDAEAVRVVAVDRAEAADGPRVPEVNVSAPTAVRPLRTRWEYRVLT